jgi:hypothetical protein
MSGPLILVSMIIYFYVGCEQGMKGNYPGFLMWSAYGVANIGLWMQAK